MLSFSGLVYFFESSHTVPTRRFYQMPINTMVYLAEGGGFEPGLRLEMCGNVGFFRCRTDIPKNKSPHFFAHGQGRTSFAFVCSVKRFELSQFFMSA